MLACDLMRAAATGFAAVAAALHRLERHLADEGVGVNGEVQRRFCRSLLLTQTKRFTPRRSSDSLAPPAVMCLQVTGVEKPLISVSRICDVGRQVVFT